MAKTQETKTEEVKTEKKVEQTDPRSDTSARKREKVKSAKELHKEYSQKNKS